MTPAVQRCLELGWRLDDLAEVDGIPAPEISFVAMCREEAVQVKWCRGNRAVLVTLHPRFRFLNCKYGVSLNGIHGEENYRARFFPVGEVKFCDNSLDGACYEFGRTAPLAICFAALRWKKNGGTNIKPM